MTTTAKFKQFLAAASGQKEVSLVIACDEAELGELQRDLETAGFIAARNGRELLQQLPHSRQQYFVLSKKINKSAYDFAAQYPTGQVELFDSAAMRSRVTTPDYRDAAIVLLGTAENIFKFQQHGIDLVGKVGLTFRS